MVPDSAMKPRIEIYLKGGSELDPYVTAIQDIGRDTLPSEIAIDVLQTRSADLISTLALNVIGSIAAHYLVAFCRSVSQKRASDRNAKLRVVISYGGESFELPVKLDELTARIQEDADTPDSKNGD
jgi:hypothetical protein